ncbi:uncharacterized protein SCHCODRAFT_02673511 [Schizophyllum commune H4-8]|nr:uncharacterized protein SCHCODRAFT_02673511 [Schizophyllum commune H4-8]KAI5885291.1 hypothetical protein SCHCODRAFT_02673511 [Schizophyllum commune H4-8]
MNDRLTAYIRTALLSRRAAEINPKDSRALIAHLQAVLAFYCPALDRTYMTAIYKSTGHTQLLQEHFDVLKELVTHPDPDTRDSLYRILCGSLTTVIKRNFDQEGRPVTSKSVIKDVISGPEMVVRSFVLVAAMAKLHAGRLQKAGSVNDNHQPES